MKSWHSVAAALAVTLLAGCGGSLSSDPGAASDVRALLVAGDIVAAETQARHLVRTYPDDPALRLLLGDTYLAGGDGAAAFSSYDRAQELGASGPELLRGLVESSVLKKDFPRVLKLLPTTQERSSIPTPLIFRRLYALLRIQHAAPSDLFLDARHLLTTGHDLDVVQLKALLDEDGVLESNAAHVRRSIAYWSCQQTPDSRGTSEPPAWADLSEVGRRLLSVGPSHDLKTPSAAAAIASDGDIVEIEAGIYRQDVAVWDAGNLWIRAKNGKAVLASDGLTAEDMGIWVIRANNYVVDGVRFEGARATRNNGSGIRLHAHNLWIRNSEFHDNEAGLLTFNEPGGEVRVEHSVFTDNGAGDGFSHNVYIGRTDRLIFRFNYSTGVRIGHQLKSRAFENYILYNRLADEADGTSSYAIDLPEGGLAVVIGNEIQQGPLTVNKHMVSLGAEEAKGRDHRFIFAYNTFYNNTAPAMFIRDATGSGVALVNNVFAGAPASLALGSTTRVGNAFDGSTGLNDGRGGDYRLQPSASFIDTGEMMESVEGISIAAQYEYVHPAGGKSRELIWRPDPGAHEFCGWPEYPP